MPKARWMSKVKSPDRPVGAAPVTRVEANLEDLKGRPVTSRVYKDSWGGNSDMMKASMDAIIDQVADSPDLDQRMIANNHKNGFMPAGTTTGTNPSRVIPKQNAGKQTKIGSRTFNR